MRERIADEPFGLPQERRLTITVSIGMAMHGGHPDYQHTLRRADAALYQAKDQGRNRVVIAEK